MTEHRGRGFTLIEVVVVVALMGLVTAVVAATATIVLRNVSNEGVINQSAMRTRALRGFDTWLSYDIVGVVPTGVDVSPTSSSWCTGANTGSNVVQLTWVGATGTAYAAAYRFEDSTGGKMVRRYSCSGTGNLPLGNVASNVVARDLTATTPTATVTTEPGNIVVVTVAAETDGGAVTLSASNRNPAQTLPPPPTTAAPATPPCTVVATNLPTSQSNGVMNPSALTSDVTLEFTFGGVCQSNLSITFDRGDGVTRTEVLIGTYPDYEVELSDNPSELWHDGPRTITVLDDGTPLPDTHEFTVN